jgi:glycine oxidase ThiO
MSYDVGVIGGGAIGLACAWRLAQNGARVVLFERGPIGHEASWAAGGMLAAQCEMAHHPPRAKNVSEKANALSLVSTHQALAMFNLCLQSRAMYAEFAEELFAATSVDVELSLKDYVRNDWREPGILFVGNDSSLAALDAQRELGARVEDIEKDSARWLPEEGQVEPRLLLEALKLAVKQAGVALYASCKVHRLNSVRDVFYIATDAGSFHCEKVLLTAGAWSGDLSTHIEPALPALPVRPVAGQMLALRSKDSHPLSHIIYSDGAYLIPRRDGRIVVGATMEERGFDAQVTPEAIAKLHGKATALVPALADAQIEETWASLRPGTPDGLPILGQSNINNLFVASGHFRNGILLTPVTAQLLTDCIMNEAEAPAEFSSSRFSSPISLTSCASN